MLVFELKDYIKDHPKVSMLELTKKFSMDHEALRGLLDKWVKKGKIDRYMPEEACGDGTCGCKSCVMLAVELYTWVESDS